MFDGAGTPPDKNPLIPEDLADAPSNKSPFAKALAEYRKIETNEDIPSFSELATPSQYDQPSLIRPGFLDDKRAFLHPPRMTEDFGPAVLPNSSELEALIAKNIAEGTFPLPFDSEEQGQIQETLERTFIETKMLIVPESFILSILREEGHSRVGALHIARQHKGYDNPKLEDYTQYAMGYLQQQGMAWEQATRIAQIVGAGDVLLISQETESSEDQFETKRLVYHEIIHQLLTNLENNPKLDGLSTTLLMGFYHLPIGTRRRIEEGLMREKYATPVQRGSEYWTHLVSSLVYPSEKKPDLVTAIERSATISPVAELLHTLPFLTNQTFILPQVNEALGKAERVDLPKH